MLSRCLLSLLINARLLLPERATARVDHHCFFRTAGKLSAFGANSLLALAGALCVLVLSGATARAQVSLTPLVSFDGTLYTYNYSVGNLSSLDLAIISFDVLPQSNAVLNPAAPTGFLINFDPGVGQVSFFEDTDPVTPQTFGPGSTVSGFIFQSPIAPGPSSFTALDVNGNTFMGTTGAPRLTMTLTTTNTVIIAWPSPSTGWHLQQNANLSTTNWLTPSETITDNGTTKLIIVNPPNGNRFFRLVHP